MRLRDFSTQTQGQTTLICAPYALHGATIADFAPGHSVVEALRLGGLSRMFVADWRSATAEMRYFSIDSYLSDLNVAVDDLGSPVDLVGLCQGGWLALVYAARFPQKVRRLVLFGAPVDVRAGESQLSRLAASVPLDAFEELVRLGEGLVLGQSMLPLLGPALDANDANRVLQITSAIDRTRLRELHDRFHQWYVGAVNLPGTFYLQVCRWLFKENQIAEGRFVALGRRINLAEVMRQCFCLLPITMNLSPPISSLEPQGSLAHRRLPSKWRRSRAATSVFSLEPRYLAERGDGSPTGSVGTRR